MPAVHLAKDCAIERDAGAFPALLYFFRLLLVEMWACEALPLFEPDSRFSRE
jgi:hypothetical protein